MIDRRGSELRDEGGPLAGVRVLEMDAIGPVPFCAMMLTGMGADVLHIARAAAAGKQRDRVADVTRRGRPSVALDLKADEGLSRLHALAAKADILLEGSRPGAMEKLGIGPDTLRARNPRLVYGRMTGWGQTGTISRTAGHDINYIALSGALHAIGRAGERPVPPLNLVGDYGGGAMFLAVGVLAAYVAAQRSGSGQVVDAAMLDGAATLMSVFCGFAAKGTWEEVRGSNLLDGGAPWYDTYETADGEYVAVGALEEPFWLELLDGLGLSAADLPARSDRAAWPTIRNRLSAVFRTRSRSDWASRFELTDACVTPVLKLSEAANHPHVQSRGTFIEVGGVVQPAPAPRFEWPAPPPATASWLNFDEALARWSAAEEDYRVGGTQ
jgi:alpha-methylacyl-CoA racemase